MTGLIAIGTRDAYQVALNLNIIMAHNIKNIKRHSSRFHSIILQTVQHNYNIHKYYSIINNNLHTII